MNGQPHYKTSAGGHIYYHSSGLWFVTTDFEPSVASATAYYDTVGALPKEATWAVLNCKLTLVELTTQAEVATADVQFLLLRAQLLLVQRQQAVGLGAEAATELDVQKAELQIRRDAVGLGPEATEDEASATEADRVRLLVSPTIFAS